MTDTYGRYLLNKKLPDEIEVDKPMDKGKLRSRMKDYARENPDDYVDKIQDVKEFGDYVSTLEGLSVGLEDIEPDYKNRNQVINEARQKLESASSVNEKRSALYEAEDKMKDVTKNHPSDMTLMAESGGRGSVPQLMKTVASPVIASNKDGEAMPHLIEKSYAEGLDPGSAWVANEEARRNVFEASGSVVEPGAMAKVVVNTMHDEVVTQNDCGTNNGIKMETTSEQLVDRYPAGPQHGLSANEPITSEDRDKLLENDVQSVQVRSPMTCEVKSGTCQKCMGLDNWGKDYEIGTNVGARSAQALTEPLTQFVLNAKHGVRYVGDGDEEQDENKKLKGLDGFKVLTEVPKSFTRQAQLAEQDGEVTQVEEAPQGGHYVHVEGNKHYTPPGLRPKKQKGDRVEKGDVLTKGVPMPDEIVKHKGLGAGRKYLADELKDLYKRQGEDIDKRHTELLAKKAINYVRVEDDPKNELVPGDTVEYNKIRERFKEHGKEVPVSKAVGERLAAEALHHSAGTRITPSIADELRDEGIETVTIATGGPKVQPIMKSIVRTPLMKDDWQGRLSHRYLKKSLIEGAQQGDVSDVASTDPVPAYVEGADFGYGEDGKYAAIKRGLYQVKEAGRAGAAKMLKNLGGKAKKFLFGAGDEAIEQGDGIRYVGKGGGFDFDAHEAKRLQDQMESVGMQPNFFDEAGTLTDDGFRQYDQARAALGGKIRNRKGTEVANLNNLDSAERLKNKARAFNEYNLTGENTTPEMIKKLQGKQSLGKSIGRNVKDLAIGYRPIETTKQRFRAGGLLGKQGLIRGGIDIDPGTRRAYRLLRDDQTGRRAAHMASRGLFDFAGDKALSYGLPAVTAYTSLTSDRSPRQKTEDVFQDVGEAVGWSVGQPFGAVGWGPLYGKVREGFGEVGRQVGEALFPEQKGATQAEIRRAVINPRPDPPNDEFTVGPGQTHVNRVPQDEPPESVKARIEQRINDKFEGNPYKL